MVSDRSHFPTNEVTKFHWSNEEDLDAVILFPWGKVGKREDGGDKDDSRDGGDYAQGEGTKRKKGKTKSDEDDSRDGGDYAQGEGIKRKKGNTKSA